MINVDLTNVQELDDEFARPTAGGYVAEISDIELNTEKQYLKIFLDIAEGELAGYYEKLYEARDFWALTNYRSYKPNALPFFKQFVSAVEASNKKYKWNGDERKLLRKNVGIILQAEEYTKQTGEVGERLVVSKYVPVDDIKKGNFKVPEKKWLNKASLPTEAIPGFVAVEKEVIEGIPFN